ncbi:hypothetical protein RDI58_026206 [Solanum bulbocastanum]|uniref:Gag1-like clamp domain-containing protein n=1 Tax=Solanum bulbocastanum TaxID=147425 RepID=A0AAN8STB7_SOLBU
MEVDTGNSCFIEKLPVERYTSTRETKKPPETNKSPAAFVNHDTERKRSKKQGVLFVSYRFVCGAAAIAWHENRRKWVGEVSSKSERMPKDPIIRAEVLSALGSASEKSSIVRDTVMSGSFYLYCTEKDNLYCLNLNFVIYNQKYRKNVNWSTTYEELLSTTDPFSERIPLTEMVDFLVDIWHDEGLFD